MWLLLCCEAYKFDVLMRPHTSKGIMVSSLWHLNHVFCLYETPGCPGLYATVCPNPAFYPVSKHYL